MDLLLHNLRTIGTHHCDQTVGEEAAQEIERLRALARDAYDSWEHDRDAKVGKLLRAMLDAEFSAVYRPDLVPNA